LFIVFNRPDTTQRVFDAIRFAKPNRLYIAADAPRNSNDQDVELTQKVRAITELVTWPCEVKRLYQSENLGCSFGPRAAFDWFFTHENEGIILEDDCLPHPDFFSFATTMLEKYRNNNKIISINGSNLGYTLTNGNSYTFSRFMNMWGWATWANRAKSVDYTLASWKQIKSPIQYLHSKLKQHPFDTDFNWCRYWKHKFDLTVNSKTVSWWDWQWIWHQINHAQYSVVPARNLVSNIGFNNAATHTKESDNPAAAIPLEALPEPYQHPKKINADFFYEENYVKWIWCYYKRMKHIPSILNELKNIFK